MAPPEPRDTSYDIRITGRGGRAGQDMGQPGTPTIANPEGRYPFPSTNR